MRARIGDLRLLDALGEVHAYYRTRADRRFEPGATELATSGLQFRSTDLGDLELLGTVGAHLHSSTGPQVPKTSTSSAMTEISPSAMPSSTIGR